MIDKLMKGRLRILVEYLAASLLVFLLMLAIAGVVVVKYHGEELRSYVMHQINNRLDSSVKVGEASVKVFHKFPNTSIVLKDITIWSSHNFNARDFAGQQADTLLTAQTVSISFNLFSLMRKKYNIRQMEIGNGMLNLYTDKKGEGNYKIITGNGSRKKDDPFINLTQMRIADFQINLNNQAKQLVSGGSLTQLDLNGKLSKKSTQIKGSMSGRLNEITNKGIRYASERDVEARLNLTVDDSTYTIKSGQLRIDRILADVDGLFVIHKGQGVAVDLYAAARDLEIHEILDLLPGELSNPLKELKGNGIMQFYTRIKGLASSTLTPSIEADFQTSQANLQWSKLPFKVRNLNLTGSYSNGGAFNPLTTSLVIESLTADIGKDHISGRGRIHNFLYPDFSFYLKGDIHPGQWIDWYESIPLYKASGLIISDIKASGTFNRQQPRGKKFLSLDISGGITLEDVMVLMEKEGIPFSNVNGSVRIDNDFWKPSFSGSFGRSDFKIYGSGFNLLSFLTAKNEVLVASGVLRSNLLDLQEVLDNIPGANSGRNSSIYFPEKLNLKLDFVLNKFYMDKLAAEHVRGVATYDAPFFYVDSLSMQTMDGILSGSLGMVQNDRGRIFINVNSSMYNLDIRNLFYSFNNFRQSQLTDQHLKGTISGNSIFSADFDSTFNIHPESIHSENNVTILDGELNGFSPIMALSRFIDVDELQHIQFQTLENNILIKESQVIIPSMDIQSNALNLSASGTHGFDNHYDYRIKLKLSQLLYNKAKHGKNHEFEIAADESDTRTLFLKIYNNGSGPAVELDREKTAHKIRNDLKEERSELKNILNSELGLFQRDTTRQDNRQQEAGQEEGFRFEFSDEPDTVGTKKGSRQKRKWWKKQSNADTLQNKHLPAFVLDEQP